MAKFKFRLEKLHEYRHLQEKWAKDAYLEALARKVESEEEVEAVKRRRLTALNSRPCAFDERRSLETYLTRLDDEQAAAEAAVAVMESEVEIALQEWNHARHEAEAMTKLREADEAEWTLDQNRKEQSELDEWAVTRRAS